MYLFDELSQKLKVIDNKVKQDITKLRPDEWREWRIYNFLETLLSQVPGLREKDEKEQLTYLFGMEFLFWTISKKWDNYFGLELKDKILQEYFLRVIEVVDMLRKKLGISISGDAELEAEYFCKNCNAFYYHKNPFLVHCFKCEGLLDFIGIIPVKKVFTGFRKTRINKYYSGIFESIRALDI